MAIRAHRDFFRQYHFAIIHNGASLPLSSITVDPFTGTLWLERAQKPGHRLLHAELPEEGAIEAYLLNRDLEGLSRCLTVKYSGKIMLPLNLDNSSDDVVLEWTGLKNATYEDNYEVRLEDLPDLLRGRLAGQPPGQ